MNTHEQGFMGMYDQIMVDLRDPRVDNWLLMSSPWPTFVLCVMYYYIVRQEYHSSYLALDESKYFFMDVSRFAGISYMKEKEAFDCRKPMFVYNSFQIMFSFWVFFRFGGYWLTGKYNWKCQPVDYSHSVDGLKYTWFC